MYGAGGGERTCIGMRTVDVYLKNDFLKSGIGYGDRGLSLFLCPSFVLLYVDAFCNLLSVFTSVMLP
jgi:hypothetical protein